LSISELALLIQKITGYTGEIQWDDSKPDGTPRKLMDVSLLKNEGWSYSTDLENGIRKTYSWFLENEKNLKKISL
jgi:GDP-L-fucose synthase